MVEGLSSVIVGKTQAKQLMVVALLGGGHVLIEGFPGTAKTMLAKTFARIIGGEFKRVQLTPDMLPTDITGFYLYTLDGNTRFIAGPLFAHVVLADELNRTTPRTQAAFLEAMQEGTVTIEGRLHPLPKPFILVATQIPYGAEGTYPLTEVQMDRFMFRLWSGYPSVEEEAEVLRRVDSLEDPAVTPVVTPEEVLRLREEAKRVFVADNVREYIVSLVRRVREDADVLVGPSPRATIGFFRGARGMALMEGRGFVIPDDVKALAVSILEHRIRVKPEAEMEQVTASKIVARVLEELPVPRAGG
ncbi:MAG: MoxR family ATPase [Chloroflexi bacterium]|nr:MoxR family ATPase [Chloroflexota bacterium]